MKDIDQIVAYALARAWDYDIAAPPDFDERAYLAAWPDVAEAVRRGEIKSAFVHYMMMGRKEGRPRPVRELT